MTRFSTVNFWTPDAIKHAPIPQPKAVEIPCIHRGEVKGVAECGCAGKPKVYWCNLLEGHCTIGSTGKTWLKIGKTSPIGEKLERIGMLKPCVACPKRSDGTPNSDFVTLEQPTILCDLPDPSSRRAIITVAPDEHTQGELHYTRKPMQDYARRFGYDFVEITNLSSQPHKCGNKYAYAEVASRYEQSLWLDTDVFVRADAPNIFHEVEPGQWGLADDLPGLRLGDAYSWFNKEWIALAGALGLEAYNVPHAWNSGVVIAPRDAAKSYHPPPKPVPNVWCIEQHYHTRCLLDDKADVVNLDRKWNVGYWDPSFKAYLETGYFIHLGGCNPHNLRLQLLEHFAAGNRSLDGFDLSNAGWKPKWTEPTAP